MAYTLLVLMIRVKEGYRIGGYESARLPLKEVIDQVAAGNVYFCGRDGKGKHAVLIIEDENIRNMIFDIDYEPVQLTQARILKMLKANTKDTFTKQLEELVVTYSEALEMLWRMDDLELDKYVAWKQKAIEDRINMIIANRGASNNTITKNKPNYR